MAAVNENFIHKLRRGIGCGLGSRFAARMSWKLCAASSSRERRGLVVADLQREPSAQMLRGLRDEARGRAPSPSAPPSSAVSGSCCTSRASVRDLARGDVGQVRDDEVELAGDVREQIALGKAHALREPEARAHFRARARARRREISTASTCASGHSAASVSAITPLPVPTSSDARRPGPSSEDEFAELLRLRPRDERAFVAEKSAPEKFHRAEQMLERFARARGV